MSVDGPEIPERLRVRARRLVEMGKEYIESARLQGERPSRMLVHELLPNVWPQALVQATLCLGINTGPGAPTEAFDPEHHQVISGASCTT